MAKITEIRILLEEELNLLVECHPRSKRQTVTKRKMDNCPSYLTASPMTKTSVRYSSPAVNEDEDYILSGYTYLIKNDGGENDIDGDVDE